MSTRRKAAEATPDISRRTLLQVASGIGVGSLSGLALSNTSLARQEATPGTAPTDMAESQILRVVSGTAGTASFTFTPLQGGGDQQYWQTLMWMPPMYFDNDGELRPGILNSWEPNTDYTEWTFTVDPVARWSDGSAVTASDVKGTWELMTDPLTEMNRITGYLGKVVGFAEARSGEADEISGLVLEDDLTLKVTLTTPDPVFHWRIATTHMNPVKIDEARDARETFWLPENSPSVSGPFMLSAYDPDKGEATMVPNPNWWLDEGPYLTELDFRFAPDQQVQAALVTNNEADAWLAPLPLSLMEEHPEYFRPHPAIGFNTFFLNFNAEPTNDPNVRKALTLAVNFEDVFMAAYPGGLGATRATQIVDLDLPCHDTENEWYPYDPEAAQAALAESTYGSADALPKIRVSPRGNYPPLQRALESILEFWRQNLGITNVEFKAQNDEYGPDISRINVNRDDVVIRMPDTATYMWTAAHSEGGVARPAGPDEAGMLNGYKNDEVDALLEEALVTPVEDENRCALALEAQRLFMEDYPLFLLADEGLYLNAREYVANFHKGPDTPPIEPWKIYLAKH